MSNQLLLLHAEPLVYRDKSGALRPMAVLPYAQEERALLKILRDAGVELEVGSAAATVDRLLQLRRKGFSALHFSTHGASDCLALEDGRGGAHLCSAEELARLLSGGRPPVKFVMVSACMSEAVGRAFVAAGIPHVVAVRRSLQLENRAAMDFSRHFYHAALHGASVAESFRAGVLAVSSRPADPQMDWGAEAQKFVLLPADAAHDECLFQPTPGAVTTLADEHDYLPPPSLPFFGRGLELHQVVAPLLAQQEARLVAVVGAPGVGKSAVLKAAAAYVAERRAFEDGCCWVDVVDVDEGAAGLVAAVAAAAGVAQTTDADALCRALYHRQCLVVVDNCAPDSEGQARVLQQLLERTRGVRVLLSAPRALRGLATTSTHGRVVRLGGLDSDSARRLLRACVRLPAPQEARAVELCDGSPLAIRSFASAAGSASGGDAEELVGLLERQPAAVLARDEASPAFASIALSYRCLPADAAAALRAASLLLNPVHDGDVRALCPGMSADAARAAVDELASRALAERRGAAALHVPSLVRAYVGAQLTPEQRDDLEARRAVRVLAVLQRARRAGREAEAHRKLHANALAALKWAEVHGLWRVYAALAAACAPLMEQMCSPRAQLEVLRLASGHHRAAASSEDADAEPFGSSQDAVRKPRWPDDVPEPELPEPWALPPLLAAAHTNNQDYDAAERILGQLLETPEWAGPAIVDVLERLAGVMSYQERPAEARQLFERALEMVGEAGEAGGDPQLRGRLLAGLGDVTDDDGVARALHQRALELRTAALGAEHPDVAASLFAVSRLSSGSPQEAVALMERAQQIWERAYGAVHADTATASYTLAELYLQVGGRQADAERAARAALSARQQLLGLHLDTAHAFDRLGAVLEERAALDEALKIYVRALLFFRELLGEHHPDALEAMNSVADLHMARGNFDEARAHYEQVLAKRRFLVETHGESEHVVALSLSDLGKLAVRCGDWAAAEAHLSQALPALETVLGRSDGQTVAVVQMLGELMLQTGRTDAARRLLEEAVASRRALGDERELSRALIKLGNVFYSSAAGAAEAEACYREALELRVAVLGEAHYDTAASFNALASFLHEQGRLAEAEGAYRAALSGYASVPSDDRAETVTTVVDNVAQLLLAAGNPNGALEAVTRCYPELRAKLGDAHPEALRGMAIGVTALDAVGRGAEARSACEAALPVAERVLGVDHEDARVLRKHLLRTLVRDLAAEPRTLATLRTLCGNALLDDERKWSVRLGNEKVQRLVGRFAAAVQLLQVVGFANDSVAGTLSIAEKRVERRAVIQEAVEVLGLSGSSAGSSGGGGGEPPAKRPRAG